MEHLVGNIVKDEREWKGLEIRGIEWQPIMETLDTAHLLSVFVKGVDLVKG